MFEKNDQIAEFADQHSDPAAIWLNHHIPKTAGSSLVAEIEVAVGPERFVNLLPTYGEGPDAYAASLERQAEAVIASPTPPRVFSGHLGAPQVDLLARKLPGLKIMTFLRHPVARVISEYNYCRSPRHPEMETFIATYPTLDDYIADKSEMNKAAMMMFGSDQPEPEEAIARMMSRYTLIGLQERYPISFLLMSAMIWAPTLPSHEERVGATRAAPDQDLVARISAANHIDLALYTHVAALYDAQAPNIWAELRP